MFSVIHMKQKTLIEIPPYFIDTLNETISAIFGPVVWLQRPNIIGGQGTQIRGLATSMYK
jgi:hypothetical protein